MALIFLILQMQTSKRRQILIRNTRSSAQYLPSRIHILFAFNLNLYWNAQNRTKISLTFVTVNPDILAENFCIYRKELRESNCYAISNNLANTLYTCNGNKINFQEFVLRKFILSKFKVICLWSGYYYMRCWWQCCSKWSEQLSSRISSYVASPWFSSWHWLLPSVWSKDDRSDYWTIGHCGVCCIQRAIPIRHCSKFRHSCRKTLHRGSRRLRRRSVVCN